MSERITDEKLDHLIRVEDAMRCRMTSVLATDDGFAEGNVHAGVYRALVELRDFRARLTEATTLVRHLRDHIDPRRAPGSLYGRADDFLAARAADSATDSPAPTATTPANRSV